MGSTLQERHIEHRVISDRVLKAFQRNKFDFFDVN